MVVVLGPDRYMLMVSMIWYIMRPVATRKINSQKSFLRRDDSLNVVRTRPCTKKFYILK